MSAAVRYGTRSTRTSLSRSSPHSAVSFRRRSLSHSERSTNDSRRSTTALVIALHQLRYPGLVTNNYKMLKNPKELAAIIRTRVTVFAIEGVGDDPIRATGALLLDLPRALKRFDSRRSQVFWLRPRNPAPEDPMDLLARAAKHQHRTPA